MNPLAEDLINWKERGFFWSGDNTITIYESTTVLGNVEIDSNTWVGPFCLLDGTGGLKIGSNCSISTGVQILTHDSVKWALSGGRAEYDYSPTLIGKNCFVGSHAIITRGCIVGNNCLIAAGAVLTKSFPNNSIIAGVPAKKIGNVLITKNDIKLEYY